MVPPSEFDIEFYYNGAWSQIAKIGAVQIVVDAVGVGDGKVWTDQKTCAGGDGWVCGVKASRWIGRKKESHLLWTRLLVLTSNAGFRQGADRLLE